MATKETLDVGQSVYFFTEGARITRGEIEEVYEQRNTITKYKVKGAPDVLTEDQLYLSVATARRVLEEYSIS